MLRDPKILRSLQYFEAVAVHSSVRAAADELGVSPSAISHQIRALTAVLGETLFKKSGRGIRLTDAGNRLHERLGPTFREIDSIIRDVVGGADQTIRLAVCSSFGPAWLAPRLADFQKSNPGLGLELRLYTQDPEQTHATADAVVTALPVVPGYDAQFLFDEKLVAVIGAQSSGNPRKDRHALITTDLEPSGFAGDWFDFEAERGIPLTTFSTGEWLRCSHYLLAMELARSGMGVALVPDFLAESSLTDGTLRLFDAEKVSSGRTYQLCYKSTRAADPSIRALIRWMKSQTAQSPA